FRGNVHGKETFAKIIHGTGERGSPCLPKIFRGAIADAGKQFDHPVKSDFIARIRYEPDKGSHILNVRLLEKANTACDLIRDAAAGKLQLQLHSVIMRTVEDSDLVKLHIFIAQFENPLSHELCLLRAVV